MVLLCGSWRFLAYDSPCLRLLSAGITGVHHMACLVRMINYVVTFLWARHGPLGANVCFKNLRRVSLFPFLVSRVDAALALAKQKSAEGIRWALWAGQGFCSTPVCRAAFVRLPEAGTQDCREVMWAQVGDSSCCLSYSESLFGNYTKNESLANRGESCEG